MHGELSMFTSHRHGFRFAWKLGSNELYLLLLYSFDLVYSISCSKFRPASIFFWLQWFDRPDLISILHHATIRSKVSCPRDTENTLCKPLVLVLVGLVNQVLGIAIALEVIRDKVEITVINDTINEW